MKNCPTMASVQGGRITAFCEKPLGHKGPCGARFDGRWKEWTIIGERRKGARP